MAPGSYSKAVVAALAPNNRDTGGHLRQPAWKTEGDGLRAWKQNDAGARTYYLHDGSDPIAEPDASGNVQALDTFGAVPKDVISSRTYPYENVLFYTYHACPFRFFWYSCCLYVM